MTYDAKSVRLTFEEHSALTRAAAACRVEESKLVQEAILHASHLAGLFAGHKDPTRSSTAWRYLPKRDDEVTGPRMSLSLSPTTHALLSRAATFFDVAEPAYLIGATLLYIAHLKKADRNNAALASIKLPPHYR